MKEFQLENQGSAAYLLCSLEESDALDTVSMGMLTNNNIQGLAKTFFTQINREKTIRYDVSAQVPLEQFYTGTVNRERLLKTFRGIAEGLMAAEGYMIPLGSILLDQRYIFVNVSSCKTSLICLPVSPRIAQTPDLREFFRGIMFAVQFDQSENCDYMTKIINYLNGAQNFSLLEFHRTLCELLPGEKEKQALYTAQGEKVSADEGRKKVVGRIAEPVKRASAPSPAAVQAIQAPAPAPAPAPVPSPPPAAKQPGSPLPSPAQVPVVGAPATQEDKISFLYLMQHYNKENAARYKAQKEARKASGASEKVGNKEKKAAGEKKGKAPKPQYQPPGFSIPGQPVSAPPAPIPVAPQVPRQSAPPQPEPVPAPAVAAVSAQAPVPAPAPMPQGDFGDTSFAYSEDDTAAGTDNETIILGQEQPSQQMVPHLVRKRNHERILISKEVFRLGRDAGFNDYVIADNTYVGHSHCYILSKDGKFYIVDSNSKNHTKVDGVVIPSGQQIKLTHGSIIFLADEEFEFRLF